MPPIVIILIMAVIFTVVMAVGQTGYWAYVAKQERESKEIIRRLNMNTEQTSESLFRDRARDAAGMALGALGEHLYNVIEAADSTMPVMTLLIQMAVSAIVGLIVMFFLLGLKASPVGLLFFLLPYFFLRRQASVRAYRLVEQLPEALDLIARSLQAGLGFNEALRACAEEMPLPIAAEFGRVFEEVRFGRDYREAFLTLLRRNPTIFDLRLFVSSVLLQRETGGNLIEILESISGTIRNRFLFQAKVKAMTSEARFSALILGALPLAVAMMVSVMNPTYLRPLVDDPLGNMMFAFGCTLYTSGGFLMYKLSQVDV